MNGKSVLNFHWGLVRGNESEQVAGWADQWQGHLVNGMRFSIAKADMKDLIEWGDEVCVAETSEGINHDHRRIFPARELEGMGKR